MFTVKHIREDKEYMPDIGKRFVFAREPFPISGIFYIVEVKMDKNHKNFLKKNKQVNEDKASLSNKPYR